MPKGIPNSGRAAAKKGQAYGGANLDLSSG